MVLEKCLEQSPPLQGETSIIAIRRNFLWFATLFAINHAVVTTPVVISTTVLSPNVGYVGNALLNIFTLLASMFLGAPAIDYLGAKAALLVGMSFYCVYIALFTVAALVDSDSSNLQYALFCTASCIGGLGAGVLWVAQGVYFARTVDIYRRAAKSQVAASSDWLSSDLAGTFAMLFIGLEFISKLFWSLLAWMSVEQWTIASVYAIAGVLATLAMTRTRDIGPAGDNRHCSRAVWTTEKIGSAIALWNDPVVFLISGINLTFGFSAAFTNGYVAAHGTAQEFGSYAVTLLAALTALTATVLSKAFGILCTKIGALPIIMIGSACFFAIPVSFYELYSQYRMRGALIALYMFQGAGRAVYESTNKAVFKEFFPANPEGAFANCMIQVSTSFAMCFFLSGALPGGTLAFIVLALSVCTPVALCLAHYLRSLEGKRLEEVKARLLCMGDEERHHPSSAGDQRGQDCRE